MVLVALLLAAFAVCCKGFTYRQPSIMVVLLARNKEHTLPYFLTLFEQLDYPKHRMALYVRADHCEDNTIEILETWLSSTGHLYHSLDVVLDTNSSLYAGESSRTDRGDASYEAIIRLKEMALAKARSMWADYVLFLDVDVFIIEPDILNILLGENQPIVAPMINSLGKYSNFWGGMSEEYWYVRTDQYMNILEGKEKGCFTVPMVHSFVLVNLKVVETEQLTFDPDNVDGHPLPLDDIIAFAVSAKESGLDMTVCNEAIYGFMTPPVLEKERVDLDLLRVTSLKLEVLVNHPPIVVSPLLSKFVPHFPEKTKLDFDHIYLINLERRHERRNRMEACFDELGFDVSAIDAVDGKTLNESKLEEMGVEVMAGYQDPWSGRQMTYGEIGCFLSHYKVWQDVVKNGYRTVLLFEDDIRFEPFFREHLSSLMRHVEDIRLDWDLIYLGRKKLKHAEEEWVEDSSRLVHVQYSYWTLCYVLSARGAAKLLNAKPLQRLIPVDEFLPIMFDKHPERILQFFLHYPSFFSLHCFLSTKFASLDFFFHDHGPSLLRVLGGGSRGSSISGGRGAAGSGFGAGGFSGVSAGGGGAGSRPAYAGGGGSFGGGFGGGPVVEILRDDRNGPIDGVYDFAFETADGVSRNEQGAPTGPNGAVVQQGAWSFTFPDGTPGQFNFIADEGGYQRLRAGSKPGNEYELFLVSRRELALIGKTSTHRPWTHPRIVAWSSPSSLL
ncbi:Glycosyl transferase family 25 [Trinorchestia longiramus]|nr:Glycosyl transferase family 25 [Trinorchestia longiramus]